MLKCYIAFEVCGICNSKEVADAIEKSEAEFPGMETGYINGTLEEYERDNLFREETYKALVEHLAKPCFNVGSEGQNAQVSFCLSCVVAQFKLYGESK